MVFELALPGIVFLGLCFWVIRRVVRAARNEDVLEEQRAMDALGQELLAAKARAAGVDPAPLRPVAVPEPARAVDSCDLAGANPQHVALVEQLAEEREQQLRAQERGPTDVPRRVEVRWIRSAHDHVAWCERRHAATRAAAAMTRDVICVARIERGAVAERWFFG